MPSFPINSFKFGLDTRRDVLTSVAGTLVTCENAHINPGGEIEKRKAFGDLAANTDVLDSNGAQGTFGLEVTDAGLVAFGSALDFGASVTQGQPTLASALVGVTYQQLTHPSLTNDSTEIYNATYHRMTAVVFSENFNGKAFACALFSDGRRFLYYDGSLVQHSANGVVMEGRTALADLGNDVLRQFQAIGWAGLANRTTVPVAISNATVTATVTYNGHGLITGDTVEIRGATQTAYNGTFVITRIDDNSFSYTMPSNPGGSATGSPTATVLQNGSALIKAPISDNWSAAASETATSGQIGIKTELASGFSYSGVSAQAAFQITANTGTFALTAPELSDGTGTADLSGGAISAGASFTATAIAIAAAVNDLTFVHGYRAVNNADIVAVFAPEAWGNFTFNLTITTTTGTVVSTSSGTTLALVITLGGGSPVTSLAITQRFPVGYQNVPILFGQFRGSATGGTGPYRFKWEEMSPVVGQTFTIVTGGGGGQNTFADALFVLNVASPAQDRGVPFSITRSFLVTVTDNTGATATVTLVLTFFGTF